MQVFEKSSDGGWGNRLNVVDENNVFVGYDFESSCCESFGYVFTDKKPASGFHILVFLRHGGLGVAQFLQLETDLVVVKGVEQAVAKPHAPV